MNHRFPIDSRGREMSCYMRDPDGYLIGVGQSSHKVIDLFRDYTDGRQ
jgi:hypothetical protein